MMIPSANISASNGNFSIARAYSAYADTASKPGTVTTTSSTVVNISDDARRLLARRNMSDNAMVSYQDLLNRAKASNGLQEPKAFLSTLKPEELQVLQNAASLAEPIDVAGLSQEGAYNLLVPPDETQDLDNNGLTRIGVGNIFTFPPQNAPQAFKDAWKQTTAGMSFGDIPAEMILAAGMANIHQDPRTGQVVALSPDDPNWVNPYASPDFDYQGAISRTLSGIKSDFEQGYMTPERYQHETQFYQRLSQAMQALS